MIRVRYFVFLFVLYKSMTADRPKQILVSVYYESKCPDSKKFINDQLIPALDLLHEYISLKLIPFEKAQSIDKRYFQCQHGPTECTGNMVQSCTIASMYGKFDDVGIADYVKCEMQTQAGTRGDLMCVQLAGIDTNVVADCIESGKGISLQLNDEYLTKLVRPKFVPAITFNGVYNKQIDESAFKDLTGTLCFYMKNAPPCVQYYNRMIMPYFLL